MKPTEPPYAESRNLVTKAGEYVVIKHTKNELSDISTQNTFADLVKKFEKLGPKELQSENNSSEHGKLECSISVVGDSRPSLVDDNWSLNNLYSTEK